MELKAELLACTVADLISQKIDLKGIDWSSLTNSIAIDILSEIREIIQEDTSDFDAIEKIVDLFDKYNIDAGGRHDFG